MYKLMLKEYRIKAGFRTQDAFADYVGIKPRRYAGLERGETALSLAEACDLAHALGCTPNDLCGWPSEPARDTVPRLSREEELIVSDYRASLPGERAKLADYARERRAISESSDAASGSSTERRAV